MSIVKIFKRVTDNFFLSMPNLLHTRFADIQGLSALYSVLDNARCLLISLTEIGKGHQTKSRQQFDLCNTFTSLSFINIEKLKIPYIS